MGFRRKWKRKSTGSVKQIREGCNKDDMYERDDSDDGVVNDDSINENNDSSFCMQMDFSCTVFVRDCIKIIITRRELERGEQSRDPRRDIVSKQSLLLYSTAILQMMSLEPRCAYEKGRDGR